MSLSRTSTTRAGSAASPRGTLVRMLSIAILAQCVAGASHRAAGQAPSPSNETPAAKSPKPAAESGAATKAGPKAEAKSATAKASKPPGVISKAEADRRKPRSSFLRPPGSSPGDRYAEEDAEIPPWRQTSFFGIQARGQFFIYVIDGSGSMIDEDRFPRATIELRRSVFALRPPQKFEVIFYNDLAVPMPGGAIPRPADMKSKTALLQWLRMMEPEGGTVPIPALSRAIALRPDAIFFLSDGALPDETVETVAKLNKRKVPIHCIDLAGGLGGEQLRRIADQSGGQYASRPGSLHASP